MSDYILETSALRLTFLKEGDDFTGFTLESCSDGQWHTMAKTTPLSHLIYKDKAGNRHEVSLNAQSCEADNHSLKLRGTFTDVDGATWTLYTTFARTISPYRIEVDYRLETSQPCHYYRWLGPCLYVGEGSFGAQKDEAIFPGLEYLIGDEPSSDTRFAAEKYANRTVPHPYKITMPLMAVSHEGRAAGLIWDENQVWGGAWRYPATLFSSPNRVQDGAANHWLALFTPGVDSRRLNEGQHEAHNAFGISPTNAQTLSAYIVAVPQDGVISILREWVDTYGLPPLPDPGHNYRENVDLCIESYLDVAWDEDAAGWHHTLADPWGPRFEPILANQLWRYSRWPEGNPVFRARARDQVRQAIPRAFEKQPAPHNVPRLELALTYGNVAASLESAAEAARELIAEQQADGSWGWTPEAIADVGEFKTAERIDLMGKAQDSATGFTSSKVIPVLKYALATGDAAAVNSVKRAADWCNSQKRPEGAQTWELHLHVPDVLAVPYLINLNLGVYDLTGDDTYLKAANRWAWTGLPFTFLWNPGYRPVMRYGTVPVFGVTFHDVQSWFGVIVHWNGLWYADALFRLAAYQQTDGPIDWYELAEGITRHGMQEQALTGEYKGMYPDAFSTVKGDEEYTWWLNPQLIGLNTMPLAGLPVNSDSTILRCENHAAVHITSGAQVVDAQFNGSLKLLLQDHTGETSYTLVAYPEPPQKIVVEGTELPQVENTDEVGQGWQWLAAHHTAIIKTSFSNSVISLTCNFAQS